MKPNLTISPKETLKPVLDYEALRALGMKYIEQLGSTYWTDYNSHDPGISTLEALCYALTELGYRMQFPMSDLLQSAAGEVQPQDTRFTARDILTTNPVTTADYRKLLIDQHGVANAWLAKATQVQPVVFADCKAKELTFKKTEHQLSLRGLWDVLLELENSDEFGNVNANGFEFTLPDGTLKGAIIEFFVHQRPDISWQHWFFGELTNVEIEGWEKVTNSEWKAMLAYSFKLETTTTVNKLPATIYGRNLGDNPDTALKNALKKVGSGTLQEHYVARETAVLKTLQSIEALLHDNRNLCEDFRRITLVSAEEVSFCADIETTPEADLEEVEARIVVAIENYLSPEVPFHTLKELLENGTPTDQIFNGPRLTHGFILTDELAKSGLRKNVYASDVINLIMDVEGVVTVSNFVMGKFLANGQKAIKAEKWAVSITANHKPRYASTKSKWTFYKNRIPFNTRDSEVNDILNVLRAEQARGKLINRTLDIALPEGTSRELNQYFTIQNDFPLTYAIGEEGLPANATQERKNQAKQLQGYLQFYDQILANFLAQVEHFKAFVSLETSIDQSYFHTFLADVPGAEYIYKDATVLASSLKSLGEDENTFLRRRNRMLDHLLARFQESFNNYVLMLYTADGGAIASEELIVDKINFLKNYPDISRRRFTALNLRTSAAWPFTESAGLKQRVARLAGINNTAEEYLMPVRLLVTPVGPAGDDAWRVSWHQRVGGAELFRSVKNVTGREVAHIMARKAFQKFVEGGYAAKSAGAKFRVVFGAGDFEYKSVALFESAESAMAMADELYNQLVNNAEGLNLIEHILLRPRSETYPLMDACIPENCAFCGDEDPYSFKLSLVLPYWPTRFRKMHYRRHIEGLAHTECAALLLPKVCWADPFAWQELEDAWHNWLSAQQKPDAERQKTATARLIRALEDVETVYPEAVLHDCEDDKDENPVILNQTKLGIF